MYRKEELSLQIVCDVMEHDAKTIRHYFFLPQFTFYLLLFLTIIALDSVNFFVAESTFALQTARTDQLDQASFLKLATLEDSLPWLRGVIAEFSQPSKTLVAIELVLLRQLRGVYEDCASSEQTALAPSIRDHLPGLCLSGSVDDHKQSVIKGPKYTTIFYEYVGDEEAELLFLFKPVSELCSQVDELISKKWIKNSTLSVAIDFFSFFPTEREYLLSSFIIERTVSGVVVSKTRGRVFQYSSEFSGLNGFIFTLDIFLLLGTIVLLVCTLLDLRQNWLMNLHRWTRVFEFWEVVTLILVIMMFTVSIQRFRFWGMSLDISRELPPDEAAKQAFELYCEGAVLDTTIDDISCFCLILLGVKVFYFLQHVQGLNIVTMTLYESLTDLGGLGMVFFVMLSLYSVGGTVLYGQVFYQMRTFPATLVYLFRIIVAADLSDYAQLRDYLPTITPLFFVSLFLLFWMFLLNLVLGVVSSAYLSSQREELSDSLWYVVKTFWLFRGPMYARDRHTEGVVERHLMSSSMLVASRALEVHDPYWRRILHLWKLIDDRTAGYVVLKKNLELHRDQSQATVTRKQLAQWLEFLDANTRELLFFKAQRRVELEGLSNGVAKQRHEHIIMELAEIERSTIDMGKLLSQYGEKLKKDSTFLKSASTRKQSVRSRHSSQSSIQADMPMHFSESSSEDSDPEAVISPATLKTVHSRRKTLPPPPKSPPFVPQRLSPDSQIKSASSSMRLERGKVSFQEPHSSDDSGTPVIVEPDKDAILNILSCDLEKPLLESPVSKRTAKFPIHPPQRKKPVDTLLDDL